MARVQLAHQLAPAAGVHPGNLLARVQTEGQRGFERERHVLADVVVAGSLAALDRGLADGVQYLQPRHDLAAGERADLEFAIGDFPDAPGEGARPRRRWRPRFWGSSKPAANALSAGKPQPRHPWRAALPRSHRQVGGDGRSQRRGQQTEAGATPYDRTSKRSEQGFLKQVTSFHAGIPGSVGGDEIVTTTGWILLMPGMAVP